MKIEPQRYRLGLSLRSIFFPFTHQEFSKALEAGGYTLGQPTPPAFYAGDRTYLSGRIATKDHCVLDIDQVGKLVAVEGLSKEVVVKLMEELTAMAKKEFRVNFRDDINYLELNANLVVTSERNPLKSVSDYFKVKDRFESLDKIMGTKTSSYEVSIVPDGVLPNSPNWFDLRITPRVTAPTKQYYVHAIYRDRDVNKVLGFTRRVDAKVLDIIKEMEKIQVES